MVGKGFEIAVNLIISRFVYVFAGADLRGATGAIVPTRAKNCMFYILFLMCYSVHSLYIFFIYIVKTTSIQF